MLFAEEINRRINHVRENGDPAQLGLWSIVLLDFYDLAKKHGLTDFDLPEPDNSGPEHVLTPPPVLTIENSPISLDTGSRRLQYSSPSGTRESDLTPLEAGMLTLFLYHPRQILTYGQIITNVWGDNSNPDNEMNNLRVGVYELRQKVEPDPRKPIHIQTVRGTGYLFMP